MKLNLLTLLIVLLLLGCSKKDEQPALIKGKWLVVNTTWEYYIKDKKAYENKVGNSIKSLDISETNIKTHDYGGGIVDRPYKFEVTNGIKYLTTNKINLMYNPKYEIRSLTKTKMTLANRDPSAPYYPIGDPSLVPDTKIIRLELVKE
jgi:hypothetical protein